MLNDVNIVEAIPIVIVIHCDARLIHMSYKLHCRVERKIIKIMSLLFFVFSVFSKII